ncbi:hypothetical protein CFAM422_005863 [Trichoderma lentiforme]|uniref:Uncharacterized protein n=1 Tax=Trichoderma lentiforme TaxID=1567552 RepID=A0A9P5CCC2_9HYPO|nr:hypothetical protein CFAM422_005863 [Trichoderma lentiforme]
MIKKASSSPPKALSTVRGFQITPAASGDEDSDNGIDTPRLSAHRGRPRIDDVPDFAWHGFAKNLGNRQTAFANGTFEP